jgi:hypothetical protein
MVPKAATFNTVETAKKATSPTARELAPLTGLTRDGPATSPPHRVQAFLEDGGSQSLKLQGIASPSADEDDALSNLSPSPQSRKFPMIKASTTSRLPIDTSASTSTLSPKLLIMKNKLGSSNSAEHTPPHTSHHLERTGTSDSASGMNFLASEMAEMVLDTPSLGSKLQSTSNHFGSWDDRECQGHLDDLLTRDNSEDMGRLMGAMGGSSNEVSEMSTHSGIGGLFKRNNSFSFNE